MPTIALEAVRFHYDDPYASIFEDTSLRLDTSWRTGLVGRNGRGKTTLLRLLRGEIEPQAGACNVPVPTCSFPFRPADEGALVRDVIRESVAPFDAWEAEMERRLARGGGADLEAYGELALRFEEAGGYEIDAKIEAEVAQSGLDPSLLGRPLSTLSGGERTRVLVLALFLQRGGYPLIDEPTNHLDAGARAALAAYLRGKAGFLLISHDRRFLDGCVDHLIALERTELRVVQGGYSRWCEQRALEEETEARARENLNREVKQLEAAARKRRTWSDRKEKEKIGAYDKGYVGRRAAKQMKRALASERRVDEKLEEKRSLLRYVDKERVLRLDSPDEGPGRLLEAEGLRVEVDGRVLIEGLDLRISRGERIALLGPNGCGKSLLLDTLAGDREPSAGRVHRPGPVTLQRCFQQPRWSSGSLRERLFDEGLEETLFRNILGVLGSEGEVFDRPLERMSEGQRKQVELARSFMAPAHLRLWDEPLDYLDITCREQIERVVVACEPTLVFVEHDAAFVDRIATRVVDVG